VQIYPPTEFYFKKVDNVRMKKDQNSFFDYIRTLDYSKLIDYGVVFLGITLISFGSYSIYFHQTAELTSNNLKAIAKVQKVSRKPKRKVSGSISWAKLKKGQTLFKGDYVVTDDFSEVNVKFDDNSLLNIPSNSLVKIDYVGNSISLEVVKGLVSLDLKGIKNNVILKKDGKRYQLNGAKGKVEVSGDKNGLQFASEKGQVRVSEIKANGDLKTVKIVKKLVKILFPKGKIFDPLRDENAFVKIVGIDKKKTYKIELLNKKNQVIDRIENTGSYFEKGFGIKISSLGRYKVRLLSDKKSFIKSDTYTVKDYPIVTFAPSSLLKTRKVPGGNKVKFPWYPIKDLSYEVEIKRGNKVFKRRLDYPHFSLKAEKAFEVSYRVRINRSEAKWTPWRNQRLTLDSTYAKNDSLTRDEIFLDAPARERVLSVNDDFGEKRTFEVSKDEDFKDLVFKKLTTKKAIVLPKKLKPGRFYWRMVNADKSFMKTPVYRVKLSSFAVSMNKKVTSLPHLRSVKLPWREKIKDASYEVIIKNSKKEEVARINVDGNSVKLPIKKFGQYFITVNPLNFNDILIPKVDHPFKVVKKTIPAPFLARDTMLKRSHKIGLSRHILNLPQYNKDKFKQVEIEVYKNKTDSKPFYTAKSSKNYHIWKTKKSGKYFYRLRAKTVTGKYTEFTEKKELLFPISPFFVTAVRVPAGKKRYYRFPYIVKKGDNLATIIRNYTKVSTVLSNRSPMIQKIIKKNKHVKNWSSLSPGKKIDVFIATDSLDKSFLYIYKKLFIVKG